MCHSAKSGIGLRRAALRVIRITDNDIGKGAV